jgi:predicted pyridoxine 5'-phosphate oxidase superfamily flavin-nucleotide-binding protein
MKQDRVRFALESPSIRTQIGPKEAALITTRDSFHLATIGENSWPYTQYRRGSKGFLRILDSTTLALADFRGDRQHVTYRALLFLMDYSSHGRLKIWATTETSEDPKVIGKLNDWSYGATIDRAFLFHVLAFEWSSQQNTAPRATTS